MCYMKHNSDPSQRTGNTRARRVVSTVATSAILALAACSTSEGSSNTSQSTRPVPSEAPAPEQTTTTISEQQRQLQREIDQIKESQRIRDEATAYSLSEQRNAEINEAVITSGTRIVELAETGEVGYFDFYNFTTGEWGRGAGNEGYGVLQHNPQYGGTETQVMVAIYQNNDGSFDLNKIKGVDISTPNQVAVSFESPDYAATMLELTPNDYPTSWSSQFIPTNPDNTLNISGSERSNWHEAYVDSEATVNSLQLIDASSLTALHAQMTQFGS